jgi:hypothetical protein
MTNVFRKTIVAAALGAFASSASAALIVLNGDNVDVIYDDSQVSLAAFGAPTLVGDLLTFSPSNFKAVSTDGLVVTAHTFNVKIVPHTGFFLDTIDMSEGGDYLVWGGASFVNAGGQTRLFDTAKLPPGVIQAITPAGLGTVSAPPSLITSNWNASSNIDVAASSHAGGAEYSYSIQNILAAFAAPPADPSVPTLGLIEKKFVAVDIGVAPIPEAEIWAMMLVGAGLVGFQLRRKAKRLAVQRFV